MSAIQQIIVYASLGALLALLWGLLARRGYRSCYLFPCYVGYALGWGALMAFWSQTFFTTRYWLVSQLGENLLLIGVGLELGYRVFRAFPGARQSAAFLLLIVFVSFGLTLLTAPAPLSHPGGSAWQVFLLQLVPRLSTGVAWLVTAVGAVILWYRLPLDAVQKGIVVGLIPYLLFFTVATSVVRSLGFLLTYSNYLHTMAYLALVVYWTQLVWRPRPMVSTQGDADTLGLSSHS